MLIISQTGHIIFTARSGKVGLEGEVDWSTYVPEINGGFKDVIKGSRMWDGLGSIFM